MPPLPRPAMAAAPAGSPRAAVLRAAEGWLRTPYHPGARVKGAGVDCLMLLAAVYEEAGVTGPIAPPPYPPDWHLHRGAERYLNGVLQYAREIPGPPDGPDPPPGDAVLFRFGRCFAHGAIVIDWPLLIHAYVGEGVTYARAGDGKLAGRATRFFSPFPPFSTEA